tara:strand:- start:9530 stop:9886 length:357 start_codon:yes stop_codon:yes gene_type:complete
MNNKDKFIYDEETNPYILSGNNVGITDEERNIISMRKIQSKGLEMFIKKNRDYGDSYKEFGIIGLLVRIQDKIKRAITIDKNNICLVEDEKMEDTLLDLHNYAAMGMMLLNENNIKKY